MFCYIALVLVSVKYNKPVLDSNDFSHKISSFVVNINVSK